MTFAWMEVPLVNRDDSNRRRARFLGGCLLACVSMWLTHELGRTRGYCDARDEALDRENRMSVNYSQAMDELQGLRRLQSSGSCQDPAPMLAQRGGHHGPE